MPDWHLRLYVAVLPHEGILPCILLGQAKIKLEIYNTISVEFILTSHNCKTKKFKSNYS
jgi:hypothetical protein